MAGKGRTRRRSEQQKGRKGRKEDDSGSSSDDEEGKEIEQQQQPPAKFVLPGDDTGDGIDRTILDEESWQTLQLYCKTWGIKQAHIESIYARFARTILLTEHMDFTDKPQFHASVDFLADEFLTTGGEFAAQMFIQTWFLRRKRGLQPPKDRRCINFTRLVIMCCDLARLGDYEILVNLWACVLHRFGRLLPSDSVNPDTRLNAELVHEVISVMHAYPDKKLGILVAMLLATAEEDPEQGSEARGEGNENDRGVSDDTAGRRGRRYLTLRSILRFSFQHPPLLFPVMQFQRILRSKILGRRYWLRRRKPSSERGVDLRLSLGLPDAYSDLFDRIESRRDAWVVASGHILLHTLERARSSSRSAGRRLGDGDDKDDARYKQLLDNCLGPAWYNEKTTPISTRWTLTLTRTPPALGRKPGPGFAATSPPLQALSTAAKRAAALVHRTGKKTRDKVALGRLAAMSVHATTRSPPRHGPDKFQTVDGGNTEGITNTPHGKSPPGACGKLNTGWGQDSSDLSNWDPVLTARERGATDSQVGEERQINTAGTNDSVRRATDDQEGARRRGLARSVRTASNASAASNSKVDENMQHPSEPGPAASDPGHPQALRVQSEGCTREETEDSPGNETASSVGYDLLTPLHWPASDGGWSEPKSPARGEDQGLGCSTMDAKGNNSAKSPSGATPGRDGGSGGGETGAIADGPSKLCPNCLKRSSRVAMCRKCGRRAAKALKDAKGSRLARVILVPYGNAFGVGELDALEREGDSVRRWVRLYDEDTGADFFYNVLYDSSVWKTAIELPKSGPSRRIGRRRKKAEGGGVLGGAPNSAPDNSTPPVSPAVPPKAGGGLENTTARETPGRLAPALKKSPRRSAVPARVVLVAEGEDVGGSVPEVVLDAHKRLYPPFRMVSQEEAEGLAVGQKGVLPCGDSRLSSRQRTPTGGIGRQGSRAASKAGSTVLFEAL